MFDKIKEVLKSAFKAPAEDLGYAIGEQTMFPPVNPTLSTASRTEYSPDEVLGDVVTLPSDFQALPAPAAFKP